MKRLLATVFVLAFATFFITDPASAQFEREWEKSKAQGNAPSYISSGTDFNARGVAYGEVDDGTGTFVERVLVVSNAGGAFNVVVVDANTGTLLDSLDVSGVSGGFRPLNDIGVTDDGIIYACNEVNNIFLGGGQEFRCYRWDDLGDSPTEVISFLPPDADGDGSEDWMGAHISVTGATDDNSVLVHSPAVNNSPNLYQFSTDDGGTSFQPDTLLAGDSTTVNVEDAHPTPSGGFYHTAIEEPATQYDASGVVGQIPNGVADSLTSLKIFESGGQTFLAGSKVDFGGGGNNSRARIANIKNGAANATPYGETPVLGDTDNIQGNGDVDVRVNDDGSATVFFLSTNNGLGAFTTTQGPLAGDTGPIVVDGQTDDDRYRPLGTSPPEPGADFTGGTVGLKAFAGPDSLYVAVEGQLRNGQGDDTFREMVVFINASSQDGIDAGTLLPPGSADLSPFVATDSMNMDMETDFGVRLTGGNDPQAFASFVDYSAFVAGDSTDNGDAIDSFEGTLNPLDGTPITGGATGGTYAYDDTSDVTTVDGTGFEFAIPHDSLGTSSADNFQFFVFYGDVEGDVVSATIIPDDGETTTYSNSEDWTAVSGTQATGSRTLPVELASFNARLDGRDAVLNWETASETNNAGFEVQHAPAEETFESVGFVDGAGTTERTQSYSHRVSDLEAGTHRFRLKQVDLDGTTETLSARTVEVLPDEALAVEKVAPNPTSGAASLSFTTREGQDVTVTLYNVLGQRVRTLFTGTTRDGARESLKIDTGNLASGTYFVRVQGESIVKTQRMTVVR